MTVINTLIRFVLLHSHITTFSSQFTPLFSHHRSPILFYLQYISHALLCVCLLTSPRSEIFGRHGVSAGGRWTQCRHWHIHNTLTSHTLSLFVLHTALRTEYSSRVSGARVGCSALSHCHYTLHYMQLHTNTNNSITPLHSASKCAGSGGRSACQILIHGCVCYEGNLKDCYRKLLYRIKTWTYSTESEQNTNWKVYILSRCT